MATTTLTTMANSVKTEWLSRLLKRAVPYFVHNAFGYHEPVPAGRGSVEWRKFSSLSAVTTALGETDFAYGGTVPAPVNTTVTTVTATPAFYGAYVELTDDVAFASIDQLDGTSGRYAELLGEQAGLSADTITKNALAAGLTEIVYAGTATSDATITSSMVFDYNLLVRALAKLQVENARRYEEGNWVCIIHPYTYAQMLLDASIQRIFDNDARASGNNPFRTGYVGTILKTDFYQSTLADVNVGAGSGGIDVYRSLFLGDEAFGTTGFAGREPRKIPVSVDETNNTTNGAIRQSSVVSLIFKPVGSGGTSDPLDEISTIGWKFSHAVKVLNAKFAVYAHHAVNI